MRKSRFNETHLITIPKEVKKRRQIKDVCQEYGLFEEIYYNLKAKYGEMKASDIKKI